MLEIASVAACGWLLMYNPTENLRLPITEWKQSLAVDTAAECETFIATRWVKAEKENREFKLERYKCVPADAVYPHMTPGRQKPNCGGFIEAGLEVRCSMLPSHPGSAPAYSSARTINFAG